MSGGRVVVMIRNVTPSGVAKNGTPVSIASGIMYTMHESWIGYNRTGVYILYKFDPVEVYFEVQCELARDVVDTIRTVDL